MRLVCGLVPQQIPVCAGVKHPLIIAGAVFAERKRNGAVRIFLPDGGNHAADAVHRENAFAALKHKRAEAERIAFGTAAENLLVRQNVAFTGAVAPADAAVQTVVPAHVADFNQPANENGGAVDFAADSIGQLRSSRSQRLILRGNQRFVCVQRQRVRLCQCFQKQQRIIHRRHPGKQHWNKLF